ncbi:MAG: hypothetical protein QW743_04655 [Candidatus Methanomethylicia archaeon]
MMDKYVKQVIRACGKNADYIVVLKMDAVIDAINRIKGKIDNLIDLGGLYMKGNFEDVEVNVFRTGKILFKNVKDEERLRDILNKLFSS